MDWSEPMTRTITFASGRSATILRELPLSMLLGSAEWDDELVRGYDLLVRGELRGEPALAAKLWFAVACAMFVKPRLTMNAELVDADANVFPASVLLESELDETVEAAFGGAASSTFPVDNDDAAGLPSSENVGDDAEQDARVPVGDARVAHDRPARRGTGRSTRGAAA